MKVPLLDLKTQYQNMKDEVNSSVLSVLESQYFIMGPTVLECESSLAQYLQCEHVLGVSSGTDAILIALMAEDIGPGDEVITTPYTFFSTGGCIARLGATPVFVDIDPSTYNIDVNLIEEKISDKTKAIIPVHLYGQLADINPILEIAWKNNLIVIEDAAQALGTKNENGMGGTFADYGCISFFPSKNLGGAGDGGLVTTSNPERFQKLKKLRVHGSSPKYYHSLIGGNFRLDAIQAAVIKTKLPYLDAWIESRRKNADDYRNLFHATNLVSQSLISLPQEVVGYHTYNQFVIRVNESHRDSLRNHLKEAEIGTEIYYPVPLHLQECFQYLNYQEGSMPHSESAAKSTLAIPIYPELTMDQKKYVVDSISEFFQSIN